MTYPDFPVNDIPSTGELDLGDVGEFGGQPGDAAQRSAVIEREFTRTGGVRPGGFGSVWMCHRQLQMVHAQAAART